MQKIILVSIQSFMFLSCGSPEDTFNEKPDFVAEIENKIDLEKCDANNCEACDVDTCQEHKCNDNRLD